MRIAAAEQCCIALQGREPHFLGGLCLPMRKGALHSPPWTNAQSCGIRIGNEPFLLALTGEKAGGGLLLNMLPQ